MHICEWAPVPDILMGLIYINLLLQLWVCQGVYVDSEPHLEAKEGPNVSQIGHILSLYPQIEQKERPFKLDGFLHLSPD